MSVGNREKRVDAFDKVTGRARYTEDLADVSCLVAKVLHSTVAHGRVKSVDTAEAAAMPGVVRVLTCFDAPPFKFPTAGHPWSTDPHHQDVSDRLLLTEHVRFYGDDVAVVIAEDEVTANRALRTLKVEYEEYPFVLDPLKSMEDGAPQLHDDYKNNILNHTGFAHGDYEAAIAEDGLTVIDKWYETPIVQHCHIENHICYAYMEGSRITVVSSTQIPHIVRRITAQALGRPWGDVRIVKPYIGGGFGNKQDALYEPLCAWLTTVVGGRTVKIDMSREETFVSNRTRHAIKFHLVTHVRKDGTIAARSFESYSNQGAYASHGHGIAAKGATGFSQLYRSTADKADAYTIFTNCPVAGAMRGYGIPQAMFAVECHTDDVAAAIGMDPLKFRQLNMMEKGFTDQFYKYVNWEDSLGDCIAKGREYIGWDEKRAKYANETGDVRHGLGMSIFWYNTAVWPISLEASSCRMVLNQDGSVQVQLAETEIGQGADTAFAQMTADTVGIPFSAVHMISSQDTDVTPFGTGAYASRQTYVGGMAVEKTGSLLKKNILDYAEKLYGKAASELDICNGDILYGDIKLGTVADVATTALYSLEDARHITAECTSQTKSNALSLGCCFAEVEVDIPLCKVKLLNIIDVHDAGRLINPQLAEAQVHGGMSMAIGYGLTEQLLLDEKTGRPLNNNLLDYKLSTMMDHPHLEAEFVEHFEKSSPFGTKALGEPPAVPGAPAIRNAVLAATGVAVDNIPLNPHNLFRRFVEEGLIKEVETHV